MAKHNRIQNQHLLWRAAFGPMAEHLGELDDMSPKKLWQQLLTASAGKPAKIEVATPPLADWMTGMQQQKKGSDPAARRLVAQQAREGIRNLNLAWMEEMVNSGAQFREKMGLFWHGHFACRVVNIFYQQQLLDIVRTNAFGNFGELLRQVSKTPAMLQFLNNQQNRKQRPNENFARELMELFTLGRGNYTETDVKEAARAFTGWGFTPESGFVFRQKLHDSGSKTFLGKTGNFNGDDIIDILLQQPQTATFITIKIYAFFVNENINAAHVSYLARRFYQSKYDLTQLMSDIFTSTWFFEDANIGCKIKSPTELLVGLRRMLPMELEDAGAQLLLQRALGQVLFYPPNVAGWPGGKSWIDSSTLMLRLRIPQILTANERINIQPKTDDDVMMGQMANGSSTNGKNTGYTMKKAAATINWQLPLKAFEKISRGQLLPAIAASVLQTPTQPHAALLAKYINASSRETYIKTAVIQLMSTPEYQMC